MPRFIVDMFFSLDTPQLHMDWVNSGNQASKVDGMMSLQALSLGMLSSSFFSVSLGT